MASNIPNHTSIMLIKQSLPCYAYHHIAS